MYKKLIIPAVFLLLCACKKDRTCSCTVTTTTYNPSGTHVNVTNKDITLLKTKKKPAKWYCAHVKISDANNGNVSSDTDWDCKLK
jgi:hypothetical protein